MIDNKFLNPLKNGSENVEINISRTDLESELNKLKLVMIDFNSGDNNSKNSWQLIHTILNKSIGVLKSTSADETQWLFIPAAESKALIQQLLESYSNEE